MKTQKTKSRGRLNYKRVFFFSLIFLVFISFSLYMFFLGRTIVDLVARKNTETQISLAIARVSNLELDILNDNREVTLQRAYELGFVNNLNPGFVSKKRTALLR